MYVHVRRLNKNGQNDRLLAETLFKFVFILSHFVTAARSSMPGGQLGNRERGRERETNRS